MTNLSMSPELPEGYLAQAASIPLLLPNDGRWVVPARRVYPDGEIVDGILIYEYRRALAFLVPEESVTATAHMLRWLPYYLSLCTKQYAQEHPGELRTIEAALQSLIAGGAAPTLQTLRAPAVFVSCWGDRETLSYLIGGIEAQLADQGGKVRFYGVTNKRGSGFLIAEAREIPGPFSQWLKQQEEIFDFVIDDPGRQPAARTGHHAGEEPERPAAPSDQREGGADRE